ncbi:MAG TPA: glutamine--fructose-6-phosphate transaminase (isomerizing) [Rubrobacter sp.]|nr:glutamine--fructose-6-phosphate transaminase (isomerizing) [Rubrobacter sp.]
MCGIVGYAGRDRCVEVLMESLGYLEYRGYDSAGLALQSEGRIERIREVGRLENLARTIARRNGELSPLRTGVGHTRWATHGSPTEENAHPQLGGNGTVAVVHNGIIENFAELKEELQGRGFRFRSETDTEVMAHLIAERVDGGESLREALAGVLRQLEGTFAVAALSAGEPGKVVAARHQSPLVVGFGEGENFLASAVQALLGETSQFLHVENGEIVEVTDSSVEVFTPEGEHVERESFEVDWEAEAVELGGYRDYMLKEIHEQPAALGATLLGRIDVDGAVDLSEIDLDFTNTDRVVVVACGTAYHAGLLGKHAIEKLARIPVEVEIASEYRYADPIGNESTLVVAISQSGETTDTLAAIQEARRFGAKVLAVTNTRGSLITREADAVLLTKAGPEICVASTKAFACQVAVLDLLALQLARARGVMPEEALREAGRGLRLAPEKVEETIQGLGERVGEAAAVFEAARCSLFLGRGISYPVALEGALKLKEISYLPSEGYPSGEMKHGPIALVDEYCPVVAILGDGVVREKTISNVEETVARGANVIAVAREGDRAAQRIAGVLLPVPEVPELVSPLVASVPLQLLAHRVATDRGLDVDKPRNLAKSVTVE